MTPTAADLLSAIQPMTQLTERSLKAATLNLFEAKVIEAGPSGRGALKRTPREAAAIAVGALAAPSTLQAGKYAAAILSASRKRGAIVDPHGAHHRHQLGNLAEVALSRPVFWDALAVLIQEWKILADGLETYARLPAEFGLSGEWTSSLTVKFSAVPYYSAHIELEVREVQPLNETGWNNPAAFFILDSYWIGSSTVDLGRADAALIDRIATSSQQEFDHRVIIALGKRLDG